jgi:hypothetical protein
MKTPAMKVKDGITVVPKPSHGDIAHTLVRAGISAVPIVGGSANELFSSIITPPLTKRRDEWVHSIAIRLIELEKTVDGFSIDDLSKNEIFITMVLHATSVAIRNHREEKLKALRNAVINSALPNPPEEDLQVMFINTIDLLTPSHLLVLFRHDDPTIYNGKSVLDHSRMSVQISDKFPEFIGKEDFLTQIIKDLYSHGLIQTDSQLMALNAGEFMLSRKTILGTQFIQYITLNNYTPIPK